MVERVLCKHEVVGSIPSGSTITPYSRMGGRDWRMSRPAYLAIEMKDYSGLPPIWRGRWFDIVNEGSVRLRASGASRADLEEDINCLAKISKRMRGLRSAALIGDGRRAFMSFAENDQAHKGF